MDAIPIILDRDPGHDDALVIVLAPAIPAELDGISGLDAADLPGPAVDRAPIGSLELAGTLVHETAEPVGNRSGHAAASASWIGRPSQPYRSR